MDARLSKGLQDFQPKVAGAASTSKRLCSKAQGWTAGTTLGRGQGGAANPNGVEAGGDHRRLVFRTPGRTPVGVDGIAARLLHNPVGVGVFPGVPAHPKPNAFRKSIGALRPGLAT